MPRISYVFLSVLLLTGCANNPSNPLSASAIEMRNLTSLSRSDAELPVAGLRYTALRDTALSIGARGGLSARADELNNILLKKSRLLDRVFNFNALMLDNHVLPPVLIEARQTLNLADETNIRIADRTFEILQQARFVTVAPTWRDYLWLDFPQPDLPDKSLLPKNEDERQMWKDAVLKGWNAGRAQADNIYTENLARIKADLVGMIRYRALLAQNMVSPPYVARTELGVTGGGSQLSVNDRVLKITALPTLQNYSDNWKTEIVVHD